MKYRARAFGRDTELSVESEGVRIGSRFVDYADVAYLSPVSHRVIIFTVTGEQIEISMLGFSFDGFWEELTEAFGARSLESLFVDETQTMLCEGEYALQGEAGRAKIALYPDSVCILPQTRGAVRIPLCFTGDIRLEGYMLYLTLCTGRQYAVGKMGYDTQPFAERASNTAALVKKQRATAMQSIPLTPPFTEKGLFRTKNTEQYWNAAFGRGRCALELFTGEDSATYLYRFSEPKELFLQMLMQAAEAVGTHREVIYMTDDQIAQKPLYRMSYARSEAVRFLRQRSDGRLIHTANHAQRLSEYLMS